MRILIADDHAVVRRGLKEILSEAFKRASFGEAANSQQTLDLVWKQTWDIVILDLTMPGRSGLQVLTEIKREYPKLPVLILSIHPEDQFAVRLLKAGAAGYMNKESAPEELVGAVRKAIAGGRYISAALADKMASLLTNDTPGAPHESLSDREFLILNLIAAGKSVSVIARELSLSVKTVSTYRGRVLEKMGMSNNAELVHYAFQNRLVKDRPHDPSQPAAAARPPPAPSRERRAAAPTSSRSRSPHPFNS
jgi:DNA-binding NarL/FixJ family response regulator